MGTQLDVFPFQEPTRTQQDIISSWLDLDDSAYTPIFQQELQDLENHLFHFENDPISSSSSSSLPIIPAAHEESSFMLDLYNFNADQQAGPDDDQNDQAYQPAILPVLEVQQCVEPDVCDTFLNDYDFGLISPTDLSPDSNNNINDQFCDNTTVSGFLNQLGDVEMSEEPMVVNTTANNMTDSNKTTDDDEDNEEGTDEDQRPKPGTLNCKNLVSERNRRKRLSQQLLSLRAIVPNITKMDKRSVLVDALSYLRNIHQETEKLQKELKEQQPRPKLSDLRESSQDNPCGTLRIPRTSASVALPKPIAQITEIDTEKIEDKRFVVKITCKGGSGVGSDILRVFESLDFEITYTALQQLQPQEVLVTIFVRVRKQGKMTEQKLKDCITSMALRTGLSLQNP